MQGYSSSNSKMIMEAEGEITRLFNSDEELKKVMEYAHQYEKEEAEYMKYI